MAGLLPAPMDGFGMAENGDNLIIVGGRNSNRTYKSAINANGTLAGWQETNALPEAVHRSGVIRIGSTLLSIGGDNGVNFLDKIYYADINADATLGPWSLSPNHLPQPVCCGAVAATDDYIYLTGGYNGLYLDTVYFTGISGSTPVSTKVVAVPGMEASWNQDALTNCKLDGYSGDWTLLSLAEKVYNPLFSSLQNSGWDVRPYYYDWRKQVPENADGLKNFIDGLGEKVNIVGHSMGGLLARAYLENTESGNMLDKMMTVGSPHLGTPLAYPAWSGGDLWKDNKLEKFLLTLMIVRCKSIYGGTDREIIRNFVPSTQNLLPTFDYLKDKTTTLFKPIGSMVAQNNWLPTGLGLPYFGVTMGTLSGTGRQTLSEILVKNRNKEDALNGDWEDGKSAGKVKDDNGDGTVLLTSSQLTGADNRVINQDHIDLVSSEEGINQIMDFLGGSPFALVQPLTQPQRPQALLIVVSSNGDPSIIDPDGQEVEGRQGIAGVFDPKKGEYKFRIKPVKDQTWVGVARVLKNGDVVWKEFNYNDKSQKEERVDWED